MPMPATDLFSIDEFLRQERGKDLLRFSTAGSVDDGKSTLIGRLLYDTQSVCEDHLLAIEGKGTAGPGETDFALLTDGLRAEREQGITIDVAYRSFATARRKFILADTPGHEQYTRNMATGASTADAAVLLIDASKGVLRQSRRHAYIASLLRVQHILVAVNKMDLVGFSEEVFRAVESDFSRLLDRIAEDTGNPVLARFLPICALTGESIVHRSPQMPWYSGPSLLEALEELPSAECGDKDPFRFPVQRVLRPDAMFRGFAGQIASGRVRPGDAVTVLPSGYSASVERIVTFDGDLPEACVPLSVTLVLDRPLDIGRGHLLVTAGTGAVVTQRLQAALVWMDQRPLECNRRYLLKHASHTIPALVSKLEYRVEVDTLAHVPATALEMNGICVANLQLLRPIAADAYSANRTTGSFILIDPETNSTAAAGMIRATYPDTAVEDESVDAGPVTEHERSVRWGHYGGMLELTGPESVLFRIERDLFCAGLISQHNDRDDVFFRQHPSLLEALARRQAEAGLLALVVQCDDSEWVKIRIGGMEERCHTENSEAFAAPLDRLLRHSGILPDAPTGMA
jgi:sulfate adenylyltransferase large subunit